MNLYRIDYRWTDKRGEHAGYTVISGSNQKTAERRFFKKHRHVKPSPSTP